MSYPASGRSPGDLRLPAGVAGLRWNQWQLCRGMGGRLRVESVAGLVWNTHGSASEVVRDALRAMEERKSKLDALRSHLAQGVKQAESGEFVDDFTMDSLINDLDNEA